MNFRNVFWGVMLILIGSFFLIQELTDFDFGRYFWPIILITAGLLLLVRQQIGSDRNPNANF
ncbi:hypothetical protein GCM10027275_42410 [Rhabdobacter roseus]|uniref:Membrane-bound ClpP family serine protease n=1 Tax=Rhabdobacter roseus TaxID=1655419 RepID=A0A840U259_9BACT|nr:DUF5668 domain-containing protein [Rhabdobacter roseus]MBB5286220.1 membrane-bound ClpP family serine protease [Rhabdobacter roseus]